MTYGSEIHASQASIVLIVMGTLYMLMFYLKVSAQLVWL